jgi:hypothetical protein
MEPALRSFAPRKGELGFDHPRTSETMVTERPPTSAEEDLTCDFRLRPSTVGRDHGRY